MLETIWHLGLIGAWFTELYFLVTAKKFKQIASTEDIKPGNPLWETAYTGCVLAIASIAWMTIGLLTSSAHLVLIYFLWAGISTAISMMLSKFPNIRLMFRQIDCTACMIYIVYIMARGLGVL